MVGVKGAGGPIPKRAAQRRNKTKPPIPEQQVAAGAAIVVPEPDANWCPMAAEWYASLGVSGQSSLYSQTDWTQARVLADVLHRLLSAPEINAALFGQWLKGSAELMTTEGARRRLRIELARPKADEGVTAADVSHMADYRSRVGAG